MGCVSSKPIVPQNKNNHSKNDCIKKAISNVANIQADTNNEIRKKKEVGVVTDQKIWHEYLKGFLTKELDKKQQMLKSLPKNKKTISDVLPDLNTNKNIKKEVNDSSILEQQKNLDSLSNLSIQENYGSFASTISNISRSQQNESFDSKNSPNNLEDSILARKFESIEEKPSSEERSSSDSNSSSSMIFKNNSYFNKIQKNPNLRHIFKKNNLQEFIKNSKSQKLIRKDHLLIGRSNFYFSSKQNLGSSKNNLRRKNNKFKYIINKKGKKFNQMNMIERRRKKMKTDLLGQLKISKSFINRSPHINRRIPRLNFQNK